MLLKKAKIVKIETNEEIKKFILNFRQNHYVPNVGIMKFNRIPYSDYDRELRLNEMYADNKYRVKYFRLIFNLSSKFFRESSYLYAGKRFNIYDPKGIFEEKNN